MNLISEKRTPAVLKGLMLGSPREEVLIPGKKFVPGRNLGEKTMDEKSFSF